ncbi:helix-turn-helix transcriptional regulator [Salmonella enterica]|nr:helix-turn-helix transcriptional regulator [Salmonella enterica]
MYLSTSFEKFRVIHHLTSLKKIRLNRAKQLLENTTIPISIIASECGYNSHASFTTYIKKEFGLTPVNLRKMSKQKKNKRI